MPQSMGFRQRTGAVRWEAQRYYDIEGRDTGIVYTLYKWSAIIKGSRAR